MQTRGASSKIMLFGATLLLSAPALTDKSQASPSELLPASQQQAFLAASDSAGPKDRRIANTMSYHGNSRDLRGRNAYRPGLRQIMSCVPYARQVSGIMVVGNAWQWWQRAAGQYARGDRPEAGSVLNFRSIHRMPLGHVAVVDRVVSAREIIIEHANWPSNALRGPIMQGVRVIDVSEANNWSAVRVELSHRGEFGAVYPTYGFIYRRPDTGVITASIVPPAPQADINPVSADLRPRAEQPWRMMIEEVAEAPAKPQRIGMIR